MREASGPEPAPGDYTFSAWWQDLLVAIGQLTAFKPEIEPAPEPEELGRARRAYPLVALLVGLFTVTFYGLALSLRLLDFGGVALALCVLVLLTGARGEIGLAAYVETVVRGGAPTSAAPFGYAGVLALLFSILLRVAALLAMLGGQAAALMAAIVGSRTALALAPAFVPRSESETLLVRLGHDWLWLAAALGAAFLLLFLGPLGGLVAALVAFVVMRMAVGLARRLSAGVSDSAYGMVQQITETAILIAVAAMG